MKRVKTLNSLGIIVWIGLTIIGMIVFMQTSSTAGEMELKTYTYDDADVEIGAGYYYKLEDIDLYGVSTPFTNPLPLNGYA